MVQNNLSAHQFKQVYIDLGYDLSLLGCIMLKVDSDKIYDHVSHQLTDDELYYAKDKKRFWINGIVADKAHVTLLYGLLRSGEEMKKHVQAVLYDAVPKTVTIASVGNFDSPYQDENYKCIVAHLEMTPELVEANERLKFLPHINTFPGYKAHITLAYIKNQGDHYTNTIVKYFNDLLKGIELDTQEIDYGGNK